LWIPTAFTPNGDGLNDTFTMQGISIKEFNMQVFEPWGAKIFESNNIYNGWDGKFKDENCPLGVYHFQVRARMQNGKVVYYAGTVTLIR